MRKPKFVFIPPPDEHQPDVFELWEMSKDEYLGLDRFPESALNHRGSGTLPQIDRHIRSKIYFNSVV